MCPSLDEAPAPAPPSSVLVGATAVGAVIEMDTFCFVVGLAFKSEATSMFFFFCVCCLGVCCLGVVDVDVDVDIDDDVDVDVDVLVVVDSPI